MPCTTRRASPRPAAVSRRAGHGIQRQGHHPPGGRGRARGQTRANDRSDRGDGQPGDGIADHRFPQCRTRRQRSDQRRHDACWRVADRRRIQRHPQDAKSPTARPTAMACGARRLLPGLPSVVNTGRERISPSLSRWSLSARSRWIWSVRGHGQRRLRLHAGKEARLLSLHRQRLHWIQGRQHDPNPNYDFNDDNVAIGCAYWYLLAKRSFLLTQQTIEPSRLLFPDSHT